MTKEKTRKLFLISALLFGFGACSSANAQCGDPEDKGKTFWNIHNILVHIESPSGPPDSYGWPHPVGATSLKELAAPIIRKHLTPCIVSRSGEITFISRGYDDRIGNEDTLTVLIWSDFEGYSYYKTRERKADPEFAIMHVGFYRPLDPEAQFLNWRRIKSARIDFRDQSSSPSHQIEAFLRSALTSRQQDDQRYPHGSLIENIEEIQQQKLQNKE